MVIGSLVIGSAQRQRILYICLINIRIRSGQVWSLASFWRRRKSSASIIIATCTFDAKKVLECRLVILVNRFEKVS
jgi:hypothetical protein